MDRLKPSLALQVAASISVAIFLIWSLTAGFLWQQYLWSIEHGERSIRHLAFVMAELAEQSLTINQLIIESMLDWVADEDVSAEEKYRSVVSSRMFFDRLVERTAKLPTIDVGTFVATDGTLLNYTRGYPPSSINLADRDYFIEQMSEHPPPLSLGRTVRNRGTGDWTFYIAKNVQGIGGIKLGVALTGVGVNHFAALFKRMLRDYEGDASSRGDAAFLIRNDGVLLAATLNDAPLGVQVFPQGGNGNASRQLGEAANTLGLLPNSLSSSADLTTFPAYVVAVASPERFLLEWRHTVLGMVAAGGALSILAVGIGWRRYSFLKARDHLLRQEGAFKKL